MYNILYKKRIKKKKNGVKYKIFFQLFCKYVSTLAHFLSLKIYYHFIQLSPLDLCILITCNDVYRKGTDERKSDGGAFSCLNWHAHILRRVYNLFKYDNYNIFKYNNNSKYKEYKCKTFFIKL